ncbi:MAG: hypothetical protein KC613_27875, partial [Myxococcales bacterium]|nr:hypothetical protein [Myxococcales bacterium]
WRKTTWKSFRANLLVPLVVAALGANPAAMPYIRDDVADGKAGDLLMAGGDLLMDGGNVTLSTGQVVLAAGAARNGVLLNNHNLIGANTMTFADPGPDGALLWSGTQARIFVAPPDNANTDGALRLVNDDGIRLESGVVATGKVEVQGTLGVGTDSPATRAEIRDDSAQETGLTVRNWRAGTNTRPFLQLMGLTTGNQGARALLQLVTGADAGGADGSNDGGLQVVVSSGGAGALRTAMTVQHDGDVGVGTAAPLGKLHVAGADSRRNPLVISSSSPGLYLHDTESLNGALRYASFAIEADGSKLFMGSRAAAQAATMGVGSRQFTLTEAGNVGVGETTPTQKLVVRGDTLIDGDLTVTGDIKHTGPTAAARYVGRVAANALQAREREIANFTVNDHHWSSSNGFFVEAYSRYYDSGYVRFYVELGYRSKEVRKIEARGDLATRFGLRMVEDGVVGDRGGHPERRFRLYAQADYYSQWEVFVRTASMTITEGDVTQDGLLGLKPGSGHQDVGGLDNNARLNSMEGDLEVTGDIRYEGARRQAARAVCYSALAGNNDHSIIMVPLPNQNADLDAVCQSNINGGWYAGGVAKANYFHQDCGDLDNTSYGGGYTSYVTEGYFESHRGNYPSCGPSNAFVCCSPQFPN